MTVTLVATLAYAGVLAGCGGLVTHRAFPRWSTLLERMVIRCLLGAAVLPTALIAAYEILSLRPTHLLVLAVAGPGLLLVAVDERNRWERRRGNVSIRWFATPEELLVALMSVGVMLSCFVGSIRYPMFEGRDPWGHLLGVRYLLQTGELRQPFPDWPVLHYIDGYPPLYDLFLMVPAALSPSLNFSAKATNALLVGMVSMVMLLLVRRLTRSSAVAMTATVLLVVLPGSPTRQIWGHSLALVLLLTGLLCALRCRAHRAWIPGTAVAFSGALLAAPSQGIKAGLLLVLSLLVAFVISRRWAARLLLAGVVALALSLVWFLPLLLRVEPTPRGIFSSMDEPTLRRTKIRWGQDPTSKLQGLRSALVGSGHSETNLDDFLFFRPHTFMRRWYPQKALGNTVPQGLGLAVTFLAALFVLTLPGRWFRHRLRIRFGWRELLLVWQLFAVLGLFGRFFGVGFYVWRFWLLLCPFACIAAAERIVALGRNWTRSRWARVLASTGAVLALAQLVLAFTWSGERLLWRLFPLNLAFAVVPAVIVLWLAVAHSGQRLSMAKPAFLVTAVLVLAHTGTAAPARLRALTAFVKPANFSDPVEYTGYAEMINKTAPGAAVFPLSDDDHCSVVIGLDRTCRPWQLSERRLREQMLVDRTLPDPETLVQWLEAERYSYVIVDPTFQKWLVQSYGAHRSRGYVRALLDHPATAPVLQVSSEPPAPPSHFFLLRVDRKE